MPERFDQIVRALHEDDFETASTSTSELTITAEM
jgi:hypothetical protein